MTTLAAVSPATPATPTLFGTIPITANGHKSLTTYCPGCYTSFGSYEPGHEHKGIFYPNPCVPLNRA